MIAREVIKIVLSMVVLTANAPRSRWSHKTPAPEKVFMVNLWPKTYNFARAPPPTSSDPPFNKQNAPTQQQHCAAIYAIKHRHDGYLA